MKVNKLKAWLAILLLLPTMLANAASWQEASVQVEKTIAQMIEVIDRHKQQTPLDEAQLANDIEVIVDRDVDFQYIANWVMGKYYRQATPEQRRQFAQVFKQTMIRTYTKSLLEFDIANYQIVAPNARSPQPDKQIVSVNVASHKGEVYTLVNYMVEKSGQWKLVNVMINGINLRITFKNQFADMMQRHQYDIAAVINNWQAQVDDKNINHDAE